MFNEIGVVQTSGALFNLHKVSGFSIMLISSFDTPSFASCFSSPLSLHSLVFDENY